MKVLKQVFSILMVLIIAFSATACGSESNISQEVTQEESTTQKSIVSEDTTYETLLFDTSFVHTLDVTIADGDWADLLANPTEKTKYKVNVTIDGVATAMMTTKSDSSREVGASRTSFLARARNNNKMSVSVAIEGEESPRTFAANADARLFSMAGLAEDSFIGMFAYLFFGANVQASLPGIMTNAVSSTSNGATDYILAAGVWNGAKNTASGQNSIIFLGIEDANWSSTGCMLPDITAISARIIETDASAEILTNTTESYFIYALDRLDYLPGDSNANYNITTKDPDTQQQITSPAWFLGHGYRRADFPKNTGSATMRRIGWDDSQLIRDALIFTTRTADENINMAGCDYSWNVSYPSAPGTLPASATVELYNWLLVARGNNRNNGSGLGIASLYANNALSTSHGGYWRSRPSLQLSPA